MAQRPLLWLARLALLPFLAFWGVVIVRIATVPENHMGWSPLRGIPLLVSISALNLLAWWRTKRRFSAAVAVVVALSVIVLHLLDHFAILLARARDAAASVLSNAACRDGSASSVL
jgi:hypothetical protein